MQIIYIFADIFVHLKKMDDKVNDIEDVFMEAENYLMTTIPSNLKQLLIMNGYEDKKALSCIDDQILDNIEEFAREVLPSLISSDEYSSYYGIFKNNIPKFKILSGFRKRVMMVADFYKTKFSKTSLQMVKRTSTKTRNVSCKRICTSDLSRNSSEPRMAKENETENNVILDLERNVRLLKLQLENGFEIIHNLNLSQHHIMI